MRRYAGLLLIMLLTLYPCLELTRLIIINGWTLWPGEGSLFAGEIAFIWTTWLMIIPVYLICEKGVNHDSRLRR